ncbi:HNH endonuclease [Desulfosporosinus sp.]|uniref:HNH endonuclease n=1 Tax=Desulfosporosinus sp. TaxID=157907 RepID=UPI002315F1F5|nr:HNH endonuclease [Desulfosporosinus sp.]MDA8221498.1 HNH endonuclease [Desulfitobacterium hafniense]
MFRPIYEPRTRAKTISSHGYVKIKIPEHPYCDSGGWVYEHRFVMEQKIGRYLKLEEVVHHKNGVKTDNEPDNLVLAENIAEHKLFHRKNTNMRKPDEQNPIITCACGCGNTLLKYDDANRPRRYITGHSWRKGKLSYDPNETILCSCGCGKLIKRFDSSHRERRFISGHNGRKQLVGRN